MYCTPPLIMDFSLMKDIVSVDDGYRLTYAGYDYLVLKTMVKRGSVTGVGSLFMLTHFLELVLLNRLVVIRSSNWSW